MDEHDIVDMLCEGLVLYDEDEYNEDSGTQSTNSFADEGVLTHDTGFVIKMKDNEKFYITVQKH